MNDTDQVYNLIIKELTSEISAEEQAVLDNEILGNPIIGRKIFAVKEFWTKFFPKTKTNNIIQKVEKKLDFTYRPTGKMNSLFFFKIAATFALVISLGYTGYNLSISNQPITLNEYGSAPDEIKEIVLSDGTKVWLNSSSLLIASEPFKDETRKVLLFGEAYFEVAPNPDQPFIVKSPGLETKVLGTHFNINAYPGDEKQEISLYEGKVQLNKKYGADGEKILTPGQIAHFTTGKNEIAIFNTDLGKPAQWRDGILRFYDEDLNSIAKKLERKFQTKILITDIEAGNLHFTANFDVESLDKILELLKEAHTFDYQKTKNGIIIKQIENQYRSTI